MSIETTSGQGFVTWTAGAADSCQLLWKRARPNACRQVYAPRCDTPEEARALARYFALTNFIPLPQQQRKAR